MYGSFLGSQYKINLSEYCNDTHIHGVSTEIKGIKSQTPEYCR